MDAVTLHDMLHLVVARNGPASERARIRPEVVGLVVLGACAFVAWSSLLAVCAELTPDWSSTSLPWRELAFVGISCAVGAYTMRKSGLLVGHWSTWFRHFKLSIAALLASLLIGWFLRHELILWLMAPVHGGGVVTVTSPFHVRRTELLAVLGVMWIPALPFIASDVWRLLTPLGSASAGKLRLAFALASASTIAVAVALAHHYWTRAILAFALPMSMEL